MRFIQVDSVGLRLFATSRSWSYFSTFRVGKFHESPAIVVVRDGEPDTRNGSDSRPVDHVDAERHLSQMENEE